MGMQVSIIAAMDNTGLIGVDRHLPWRIPEDMRHFRRTTVGRPCIMGRTTFESLGRPLPNRLNIVVTSRPSSVPATLSRAGDGVVAARSIAEALTVARNLAPGADEAVVIGGARVYRDALPWARRVYLTQVHTTIDTGDARCKAYFPTVEFASIPKRVVGFRSFAPTPEAPFRWSIQVYDLG